jgi:predicted nucleotidyltransferase
MDLHPDFRDLLAEFARFEVRYVLIGGYAVGHHAKPRATKDLDLLISAEGDNRERVAAALSAFGAPATVVQAAATQGPTEVIYLGVEPVRIDILCSADGIDPERAIARADSLRLDDLVIPVIALDDLIANKRAAARTRDLADAEMLERVRSLRRAE